MAVDSSKDARLDAALREAIQLHQHGRVSDAEKIYRRILRERPSHAGANNALGIALKDQGKLDELTTRMLAGVAAKYGKDSREYEQAGGTRTSERKTPLRLKDKVTTPA